MADGAFQLSEDQLGREEKGGLELGRKQLEEGGNANPFPVWGGERADLEEIMVAPLFYLGFKFSPLKQRAPMFRASED